MGAIRGCNGGRHNFAYDERALADDHQLANVRAGSGHGILNSKVLAESASPL
jgi:hypothetical protein